MMATAMVITVILHTNMGAITLELDKQNAPLTTQNFLDYANAGFYDNTIFHRVISNFMVQGGGLNADMQAKSTNPPIKNEANNGLKNKLGTIAMARTSEPHSASSQFFINAANNDFLDFKAETTQSWGYCVFGKVIAGMDVVMKISHVKTSNRLGHQDVPENDIIIEKVEVSSYAEKETMAEATID